MKPKKTLMLDEFGQFIMNIIKKEEIETEIFKRLELLFTSLFCVLLSSSFVSSSTSGPPLPFTSLSCAFFPPPPPSPPPPPLLLLFFAFFFFFLFPLLFFSPFLFPFDFLSGIPLPSHSFQFCHSILLIQLLSVSSEKWSSLMS